MDSLLPEAAEKDSNVPEYCFLSNRGLKQYRKRLNLVNELEGNFASFKEVDLPAHKAAFEGNVEALEEIFLWKNHVGVPALDKSLATPLHMAARNNRVEAIRWLLRYTTLSVLYQAAHGETPIHIAAALGHVESIKALLSSDEKDLKSELSTLQDKSGFTCLLLAIQKHHTNVVKLLINELGVKSVNAINSSGITAAHVAASYGNVEALRLFTSKFKRLLHEKTADGTTPVYFAAQEGRLEALRFLHDTAKCDLTVPSGDQSDHLKPIHAAAQAGHTHIVKFIVARLGADIMFDPVPDGGTPLHFAASAGKLKTVRWLVNNDMTGLLVSAKDENGDTPAHDAAGSGQVEVLKFLLDNGADLTATNKCGSTPYSNALSSTKPEMADLVVTYSLRPSSKIEEQNENVLNIEDIDVSPYEELEEQSATTNGDKRQSDTSDIVVSYEAEISEDIMPATLDISYDYATVNEIEENEKRRAKKSQSRGLSKSIQNALKPLRKSSKKKNSKEEQDLGEMGFRPAHRSNPLSKLKKHSDKDKTPATPPPTPATNSSENTHEIAVITEIDSVYSSVDQDIVARKRQLRELEDSEEDPPLIPDQYLDDMDRPTGSASHISIGSTGSGDILGGVLEKWPYCLQLDDAIVVKEKEEVNKPQRTGDKPVLSKWAPPDSTLPPKQEIPKQKPLKAWPPPPNDAPESDDENIDVDINHKEEEGEEEIEKKEDEEDEEEEIEEPKFLVKLRKTTKEKPLDPDQDSTEGAGNELKEIFLKRQQQS